MTNRVHIYSHCNGRPMTTEINQIMWKCERLERLRQPLPRGKSRRAGQRLRGRTETTLRCDPPTPCCSLLVFLNLTHTPKKWVPLASIRNTINFKLQCWFFAHMVLLFWGGDVEHQPRPISRTGPGQSCLMVSWHFRTNFAFWLNVCLVIV